ncbi:MAG: phosphoribosylglycinamide formyltransferase [Oscillospiraceae bacterium]|nr:phosphoribosylglycinamide formyltransferase [Oscillospiraceae bacterium]
MKNIIILVSGGGTNLQALIDKQEQGEIQNGRITCVISSNPDAYALQRAENHSIKTRVLPRKAYPDNHAYSLALLDLLREEEADLIVLAGFMIILDVELIRAYENQIINVHPALIPSFCGDGFYGLHVHEKALEKGVKLTGATVHFVNEICDGGAIILQKAVEIQQGDTPEILQRRVMEQAEWQILPQAVSLFCEDRLQIENHHVWIKNN